MDLIHRRALAGALPVSRGVVLDFGCGVGRLTGWLAERSQHVVGLEVTPEMLAVARRRASGPHVSWVLFDGDRLPLAAASIDQIVSVYVLQHVMIDAQLEALVQEFARVMAPGGRVVLIEQARQDRPRQVDGFLEQRLPSTYADRFRSAGFRPGGAQPIRVRSRITTALSRLSLPPDILLRFADLNLAWTRQRLGHRFADYILTFDKPIN